MGRLRRLLRWAARVAKPNPVLLRLSEIAAL